MKLMYPIKFTISGNSWRQNPIEVTLKYKNGQSLTTGQITEDMLKEAFEIMPNPINGYFINNQNEMVRITNFVGYNGKTFLKQCPHCGQIKNLEEFDYSGRYTEEKRDQSNCMQCRSNY